MGLADLEAEPLLDADMQVDQAPADGCGLAKVMDGDEATADLKCELCREFHQSLNIGLGKYSAPRNMGRDAGAGAGLGAGGRTVRNRCGNQAGGLRSVDSSRPRSLGSGGGSFLVIRDMRVRRCGRHRRDVSRCGRLGDVCRCGGLRVNGCRWVIRQHSGALGQAIDIVDSKEA